MHNQTHYSATKSIFSGEITLALALGVTITNGDHHGIGCLGAVAGFSRMSWPFRSALLYHICRIVGMSANKQMRRIYTKGIVALVADEQAVRDWAISQFVTDTMRSGILAVDKESAITMLVCGALPFPTIIRATNGGVRPKLSDEIRPCSSFDPMAHDVSPGHTFDVPFFVICFGGKLGLLSASAMAVAIGNILFAGWYEGILCHVNRSLSAFGRAGDCFSNRPVFSLVS